MAERTKLFMSDPKALVLDEKVIRGEPDPHGQAALMLMDSLIHALVDAKCLSTSQAVELIHDASIVHAETMIEDPELRRRRDDSLGMLDRLAAGLRVDIEKPRLV